GYQRSEPSKPARRLHLPGLPRLAGAALAVVAALGVVELGAYGFVTLQKRLQPEYFGVDYRNLANELPQGAIHDYAALFYNHDIGWAYRPLSSRTTMNSRNEPWTISMDADGSRAMPPVEGPKGLFAIYGDSYAASEEVNDHETFQYYLSLLVG